MKRIIIISTISLFFSSLAFSAELSSPHISSKASGDTFVCSIFNAGAREVTGLIEICGDEGCFKKCELGAGLGDAMTLPPEGWTSCSDTNDGSRGQAYCKISFDGNPKDVRALFCLVEDSKGEVTKCAPVE